MNFIKRRPVEITDTWKGVLAGCLACLLAGAGHGAAPDNTGTNAVTGPLPKLWFPVGEELVYRVYWGVIPVGMSRATTEWIQENGRVLLAIRTRAISNKFIEKLYPVNDFVESIVDPATFLPLRFTKKLSEGRYQVDQQTTFDHARGMAHWESRPTGKTQDFAIEPDSRDILTFMYYMRSKALAPRERRQYRVMADEKIYDVLIDASDVEPVNLPVFGPVPSLKMEPVAAFEGLFIRRGRAWLWVSNDDRRILTKLVGAVPVANIKALLCEVNGPGDDSWTRAARARHAAR